MKIAFIGQKGIPGHSGGIEKHVEHVSVGLVKRGHEVIVYTRAHYTPEKVTTYKGVNLVSLPTLRTKNLDAITHTLLAILHVVRQDVDIIHFHGIGPSSLLWLAKLLKPKAKVIATFHCQDYFHKKWSTFAKFYLKLGERVACTLSDILITVSVSLKNYVNETYRRTAFYIPNGVFTAVKQEADNIKQWGLEKDNYILAVSRLIPHKGVDLLLRSFANLQTDKKLVIVGGGVFTDTYVQHLTKLAAQDSRVIMTGEQSGHILEELFSNALFFVQPSESEGLSIALLEAMSYGKTALVSDIPENLEAVAECGLSFKNKNQKDLETQMSFLLDDHFFLQTQGEKAQVRASLHYDWEAIIDQTADVYQEALTKNYSRKVESLRLVSRFGSLL